MTTWTQLAPQVYVHHGAINVGIIRHGRRSLLIDYGNGDVEETLRELDIDRVEAILFTHHHRDQASGAHNAVAAGARIGVPAAEGLCFSSVDLYWGDPAHRWHLYDFPHNLLLADSLPVHETYREGDTLSWGAATISALETPGHTDGSVSYLVRVDGADASVRQYVFCGDIIYGEGQVWDLYSLQKGWQTRDYHGFMGDRERLADSLRTIQATNADVLVPSHGPVITHPGQAIEVLCQRLEACYEQYVAISALRHYYPELFSGYQDLPTALPIGPGFRCPDHLRHYGTTWLVVSEDQSAFAIDCGSTQVIDWIQESQRQGRLGAIEWLWLSHYHDDHVDAVPAFVEMFCCPVVADDHVAQVVEHPHDWRLPCISPVHIPVDRHTNHGESWRWREFTITAYHLPGQTLYHGGLLVEGRGARVLFAGDSFTMAGIDDYCMGNRNYLGQGVGFDACLALVQETAPDCILNCHVDVGFRFTQESCQFMRDNLSARERRFGEIVPWDHANYGLDEHWVRCHPYEQQVSPGGQAQIEVVFTNHSREARVATCRPVAPARWGLEIPSQTLTVDPKAEGAVAFGITVPSDASPGRWIVPMDVTYAGRHLGQYREAIVVVQ